MNNFLQEIWGAGKDLTALQMGVRAFVMFFIALFCLRVGGMRTFGKKSAFDNIIVIVLGSVLARGIAGVSSFGGTVSASLVLVLVHRFIGWLIVHSKSFEHLIKGRHIVLYKDNQIIEANLKKTNMTQDDLNESLRLQTNQTSFQKVDAAYMENNGRISFVLKQKPVNSEEG